jgi:hypothetical protein
LIFGCQDGIGIYRFAQALPKLRNGFSQIICRNADIRIVSRKHSKAKRGADKLDLSDRRIIGAAL